APGGGRKKSRPGMATVKGETRKPDVTRRVGPRRRRKLRTVAVERNRGDRQSDRFTRLPALTRQRADFTGCVILFVAFHGGEAVDLARGQVSIAIPASSRNDAAGTQQRQGY